MEKKYIYREPGVETDAYINRKSEFYAQLKAKELGLEAVLYLRIRLRVGRYRIILSMHAIFYINEEDIKVVIENVRYIHDANIQGEWEFDLFQKSPRL
ncbi:hypothetical protein [Erysipelothrix rhusiopathiae]|uniref:hypothetical protein n=1 Tax=Erysipelothrix rhusiopathiae TaxID=1648 RepID=UPI003F45A4A8